MSGDEGHLTREHVFHMTFPKETTLDELKDLFSLFGRAWVSWINSTSAHIIIRNKSRANEAFLYASSLGAFAGKTFTIKRFRSESVESEGCAGDGDGTTPHPVKRAAENEDTGVPVTKRACLFEETEWPATPPPSNTLATPPLS